MWSDTGGELPAAKRERHADPEESAEDTQMALAEGVVARGGGGAGPRAAARGRRNVLLFPTRSAGGTVRLPSLRELQVREHLLIYSMCFLCLVCLRAGDGLPREG